MTPQLQQAIRLLQLSTLDLQQEIQETIESNPMLEVSEDQDEPSGSEATGESQNDSDISSDTSATENNESSSDSAANQGDTPTDDNDTQTDSWEDTIPEELPVDSQWDDVYQGSPAPASSTASDDTSSFEATATTEESINDHLLWQLNLTPMSTLDRLIAINIIDSVQTDGYIDADMESMLANVRLQAQDMGLSGQEDEEIEMEEINAVLRRLQHFDPIGVCARDLSECLGIQLEQLDATTAWLKEAKFVVKEHLNLLGSRDFAQLMRRTKLADHELQQVIELIQTLNPKPGETIMATQAEYVVPDVVVEKHKDTWRVRLNNDVLPRVRINASYASMVKRADNSSDNTYMRNQLQEARWFLKSLVSRNETLLKVASEIVAVQRGFLEHGDEAMRPLVLHDIAEAVEMHESTISRVTTQKYLHTPRGIFELKYFFSSHVDTDGGGGCSSTAIRAIIKKLIAAEKPQKPLSDSKIADLLAEQGIKVARRTIAKYRESMAIPPSNERKRLV